MSVTFISYRPGDADYTTHTLHALEGASQSGQTQVAEVITINGVTYAMVIDANTSSTNGLNGWTPVLALHVDGDRTLARVTDWTGGGGTKPATGMFLGASGFVADMAQAISVRGPKGDAGDIAQLADGSIGKTKLSPSVQESLGKADAAISDLAGVVTAVANGPADKRAELQGLVSGAGGYVGPQLLTVSIGNSINGGAQQSGTQRNNSGGADPSGWWQTGSEVHFANALAGAPLRWGRMSATSRADKWGNYSYGGQTLATINADLVAQLYTPMDTAGLRPDVIIGLSLFENDIAQGRTFSQCKADFQQWMYTAWGRYPSARLIVNTPHPSYSYNTPAKVEVYQQVREYILSLDDGKKFFANRADVYEDPANPGQPLAGYTDASVHPTCAGGTYIARARMLPTLRRVVTVAFPQYRRTSQNFAATGTAAATGTNVSGTAPTSYTHAGSANGTIVLSADQPGCTFQLTQAAGASNDAGSLDAGGIHPITGFTQYSPYAVIRINSGAEKLRGVWLLPRCRDGVTSPTFLMGSHSTSDADPYVGAYQNGDVLTLICPPITQADAGTANPLTGMNTYVRLMQRTGGTGTIAADGTVSVTVLDTGIGLVS